MEEEEEEEEDYDDYDDNDYHHHNHYPYPLTDSGVAGVQDSTGATDQAKTFQSLRLELMTAAFCIID